MQDKEKEEIKGTYFTNGTQYQCFESQCYDCLNYRSVDNKIPLCQCKDDDGEGGFGCTITDMFHFYQDEMTNDMRNTLLPDYECPMRLTIDDAKIKGDLILAKENKELRQENYNLRHGVVQTKLFEFGEFEDCEL